MALEADIQSLAGHSADQLKDAGDNVAQKNPSNENKKAAKSLRLVADRLDPPTETTRNTLWLIAVIATSIVMIASVGSLIFGTTIAKPAAPGPIVSGDVLLAVFTASIGFLGGIFSAKN